MLKAGPDKKCKAKKSMKREVRGASPPKTGEDQEYESCKESVMLAHFVCIILPRIICRAMQPRERRPSKAWGE